MSSHGMFQRITVCTHNSLCQLLHHPWVPVSWLIFMGTLEERHLSVIRKPWPPPSSGSTSVANETLCAGLTTDTLGPFTSLYTLSPSCRVHMEKFEVLLETLGLGLESPVK